MIFSLYYTACLIFSSRGRTLRVHPQLGINVHDAIPTWDNPSPKDFNHDLSMNQQQPYGPQDYLLDVE